MDKFIAVLEEFRLTNDQIEIVISKTICRNYERQEVVHEFGKSLQHLYFILKGGFVLKYWDELALQDRTVNFFTESMTPVMGDINSFFTGETGASQLIAIKKSQVILMHKSDINFLAQTIPAFNDLIRSKIVQALLIEHNFRVNLITKSKLNFYNYLQTSYPSIIQEVPAKYIADFMGISPEWLSKLKRKLLFY